MLSIVYDFFFVWQVYNINTGLAICRVPPEKRKLWYNIYGFHCVVCQKTKIQGLDYEQLSVIDASSLTEWVISHPTDNLAWLWAIFTPCYKFTLYYGVPNNRTCAISFSGLFSCLCDLIRVRAIIKFWLFAQRVRLLRTQNRTRWRSWL